MGRPSHYILIQRIDEFFTYYHPKAPIENTGVSTSMGRNYFTHPLVEEQESKEENRLPTNLSLGPNTNSHWRFCKKLSSGRNRGLLNRVWG